MQTLNALPSSYRDNDGFVFEHDALFYRLIRPSYFPHYDLLNESGLYRELTEAGRLIRHEEVVPGTVSFTFPSGCKVILPEQLPFTSYPYEWSFDMWRDAAIVTLKIAMQSMEKGMLLKDATPFNIQFVHGRPMFIDTLSFEAYDEHKPWVAYHQFCACFLGPLLIMQYNHAELGRLFLLYPEGIPLCVVKNILPARAKLNLQVYLHIWLQASVSKKSRPGKKSAIAPFSRQKLQSVLKSLLLLVTNTKAKEGKTTWDDYYTGTILGSQYLQVKTKLVDQFTGNMSFDTVIDLGANDGHFSLLLQERAKYIIATDADVKCINALYQHVRLKKIKNILPIINVLNLPSPAIGWNNAERVDMTRRLKADLVLVLALIHHLVISANIPLELIAGWLSNMAPQLLIEFVPKSDEKVMQLLQHREDIFPNYNLEVFKTIFSGYFTIEAEQQIGETERVLFLMKRR